MVRLRKRKVVYVLGSLPQVLGYVGGPLALSRLGRRHGWRTGRPGPANLLGLVPLAAGAGMVGWAVASHYEAAPAEAEVTVIPTYLVGAGAYSITRNPMYVGGAAMQAGWAILLGSAPVLAVGLAYVSALNRWGVPFEERLLHDRFGPAYDRYREQVPRWLRRDPPSA